MAAAYPFIKQEKDGCLLSIRVQPGARRSAVAGIWNNEALKIALQAPAVDGKANEALMNFLSEKLKIRKSSIFIVTGHTSRCKLVHINVQLAMIEDVLNQWVQHT